MHMQAGIFVSVNAARLETPENYACMMVLPSSITAVIFALLLPYEYPVTAGGYRYRVCRQEFTQPANVNLGNKSNEYCKY